MKPKANYSKRKFGLLTVLECVVESNGHNKGGIWLCKCNCRRTINLNGYQLHSRKSCGCLVRKAAEVRNQNNRKSDEEKNITKLYREYKKVCKLVYWISCTKEQWLIDRSRTCNYCGNMGNNLLIGNDVQCIKCNSMKHKMEEKEFVEQIIKISRYRQSVQ